MLKLFSTILNAFLILIILFRVPEESGGLSSFTTTSNFLGSPQSARRFLNIFTGIGIFMFFGIAIKFNLLNT